MSTFEYLAVLVSIIIGLAVAHLLQAIGRVISDPRGEKLYWIHTLWVCQTLTFLIYFWWFELGYRNVERWSAPLYVFVVGYATVLYLTSVVIVPLKPQPDYEEYFFARRRWIFGFILLALLLDQLDTFMKPMGPGAAAVDADRSTVMVPLYVAAFGTAMVTKNRMYHAVLAIVWFCLTATGLWFRPEAGG